MNQTTEKKIRRQYSVWHNDENVEDKMSAYLGALWDFGHITEEEYFRAMNDLYEKILKKVFYEQAKKVVA